MTKGLGGISGSSSLRSPEPVPVSAHSGDDPGRKSDEYRGWSISWDYGYFNATGPNYDASYEGPEDGWVDNGEYLTARTREGLIEEIDAWFADKNPCGECQGQGSVPAPADDPDQDLDICLECNGTGERKEARMTDEQIKHMTERFLQWKLPADFNPDCGISAQRPNYGPNVAWEPMGTNLLDYTQAEAMVRNMVEGLPQ